MASLRDFAFTVTLISLVMGLFFGFISEGSENYDKNIDDDYRASFEAFNNSVNTTLKVGEDIRDSVEDISEGTLTGLGGASVSGAKALLRIMKLPFTLVDDVFNYFERTGEHIPIPLLAIGAFSGLILVYLGYLIAEAIMRFRKL